MPTKGQVIGDYRLIGLLGKGGFAEVWKGEHIHLGIYAALKILQPLDSKSQEMFLREGRVIAGLHHPNIVRLLGYTVDNGVPVLIMDFVAGRSLRDKHPRGHVVPLDTVLLYLKQIAPALDYVHQTGIIHRDIKPDNMLFDNNNILLSDFGIVATIRNTQSIQTGREVTGTVTYMAPEQLLGKPVAASDQYALGVVVYEWLCGAAPFTGLTATEVSFKHVTEEPQPLHERGNIPVLVSDIVMRMLRKDPKDRFASVSEAAHSFEQALSVRSVPTQSVLPTHIKPPDPSGYVGTAQGLSHSSQNLAEQQAQQPTLPGTTGEARIPYTRPISTHLIVEPTVYKRRIGRRVVVAGIVTGAATIGGGIVWKVLSSVSLNVYTYRRHSNTVRSVAWSPNGKHIASGSADNTVQVWNAADGSNVYTYNGHSNSVNSVAWSPDGKRIASGGSYILGSTVQVWNAADGSNVHTYNGSNAYTNSGGSNSVNSVAWSPDGKHIVLGSVDTTVQVWNAADGSNVHTYLGHFYSPVTAVAWSPDGKRIASGSDDNTVQVWNAADGSNVHTYNGSNVYTYNGGANTVNSVAWSPDGKRIASGRGSDDNTVQVWNAADGSNVYTYNGHSNSVNSVAWSPDGKRIASGSDDNTVQVWNAADGSNVYTYRGHSGAVRSVAWSPNGKHIASGSADHTVRVWDAP